MNARCWAVPVLLAIGLLAVYAAFFQTRDWNTTSRLLLTYALVQKGGVEITGFVAVKGQLLEHPPTRDLSSPGDGRFYCDKAPGQSFLGTPAYWLALHSGQVPPYPDRPALTTRWPADYWVTLGSSSMTAVIAVLLVYALVAGWHGPLPAAAAALALGLATPWFAYATLNYGHVAAGMFALGCLYLLERGQWRDAGWLFAAGMAAGAAVVVEYPLVVVPVVVGLGLLASWLWQDRSPKGLAPLSAFILGGIPLVLLLGVYHSQVTGSPWRFPYTGEVHPDFQFHREGWGIPLSLPRGEVLGALLFSPRLGLAWYAAVLVPALPGLWLLARHQRKLAAWTISAVFLGLLGINAGFPMWDGGWATGPRFLVPAMPLLAVAVGVGIAPWLSQPRGGLGVGRRFLALGWWLLLGAGSVAMLLLAAAGARFAPDVAFPLRQVFSDCWFRPAELVQAHLFTAIPQIKVWSQPAKLAALFVLVVILQAVVLAFAVWNGSPRGQEKA